LCRPLPSVILDVVQRLPVESRALASVGYDAATEQLELEFRSGRVYCYAGVPRSVYDWLLRTRNKGSFVTRQIAGRYPERSLPGAGAQPVESLETSLLASLAALAPTDVP
jgi:hypothetical protein